MRVYDLSNHYQGRADRSACSYTRGGKLSTSPLLESPRLSNRFLRCMNFITRFVLGIVLWKTNSFLDLIVCKYLQTHQFVHFVFIVSTGFSFKLLNSVVRQQSIITLVTF